MSFSRFRILSRYSSKFGKFNQLFLGYFPATLRTMPTNARSRAATVTNSLWDWRGLDIRDEILSPPFAPSALGEGRGQRMILAARLAY
jgi:hypothetical protein